MPTATVHSAGESISFDVPSTELSLIPFGADGAVVLGSARRDFLAGSLHAFGMAEVFGLILSGIRTGRLVVASGEQRRTVSFRDGQVVFATSTEPDQRLGATLVRLGLVTPEKLNEALGRVRPGLRLGQALRQSGEVSASGLYSALASQVREIVLSLCAQEQGDFLFLEGAVPSGDVIKLAERTQKLVLEGLQRADVAARQRRQVSAKLPAVASPAPAVPSAHERYGALVKTVCDALSKAGRDLADLRSFLEDPLPGMETAFLGVSLSEAGRLDVERVLANCAPGNEALGRAQAYEALDAFVSYALFSAKNVLPPELADSLARDFRRIHEGDPP